MHDTLTGRSELFQALASDALLITANIHLAHQLRNDYNEFQEDAGNTLWPAADITTWQSFLERCVTSMVDRNAWHSLLLNPRQEQLLWEQAIRAHLSDQDITLLNISSAAKTAMQTNQLLTDYRVPNEELAGQHHTESEWFLCWQNRIRQICQQRQLVVQSEAAKLIEDRLTQADVGKHNTLILGGFHEFTPLQSAIVEKLRAEGVSVLLLEDSRTSGSLKLASAADPESETRQAANWASSILSRDKEARIGIVVPRLDEHHARLTRVLNEVFHPGTLLPGAQAATPVFTLFMGQALSEYPVVDAALRLFSLIQGKHPLPEMGVLLRSPFLGGGVHEAIPRHGLDRLLRADGLPETSLYRVWKRLESLNLESDFCPDLLARLTACQGLLDSFESEQPPSQWITPLLNLLEIAGWPGDRTLNSEEFQQVEKFKSLITSLGELDPIRKNLTLRQTVNLLRRHTDETQYQPQTPTTPIQVMGALEGSSMHFDHCWLLGYESEAWPSMGYPNPLLPVSLQQRYQMPHATPDRELSYARVLTGNLCCTAADIVVSYARQDGERQCQFSPLFSTQDLPTFAQEPAASLWQLQQSTVLETLPTRTTVPSEDRLRGSTALIADQSACPFRALANFRLDSNTLEEPGYALDARINGILIHRALESIWEKIGDQQQLHQSNLEELQSIVAIAIEEALQIAKRQRPDLYTPSFTALEQQRLQKLLLKWLAVENNREEFEVLEREQKSRYLTGKLSINMRADRVDRLSDGSHVIIDYKTGRSNSTNGWIEPRLGDPQLPMYAVAGHFNVSATLIAQVHPDAQGFIGLCDHGEYGRRVKTTTDWSSLMEQWRLGIAQLAEEYCNGLADVAPQPGACTYCKLKPLCRVGEQAND